MYHAGGGILTVEEAVNMQDGAIWEISLLFTLYYCESKAVLEVKSIKKSW